ncbi:MAG: tRNA 5-methoxyuridine(34)/uridine 5-oxyacetic acid(34) synthase CmoB [Deltaproteobacteria bacterium]
MHLNYLDLLPTPNIERIRALLQKQAQRLAQPKKGFLRYQEPFRSVRHLRATHLDFSGATVVIGRQAEISPAERAQVGNALRAFMPWRKGPWSIFGIDIDAEWRSERKWNRLWPELPELTGKIIADIGCNNGYYMFRMTPYQPRLVLGFEPYLQHYYAFQTLNSFAGLANLQISPLGVEDIGLFEGCFDVIFLMGILYHRSSPVECLRKTRKAMRPGGALLIESQAIAGEQPVALFPEKTYAKVPGTYFVPTASCLCNWAKRAGFSEVRLFCSHPMSCEEQRRTAWMDFESYQDFIDPNDPTKTIEGYPAPLRIYVRADF